MKLRDIIKPLFCNHKYHAHVFIKNIHCTEIIKYNARSIWMCNNCHKLIYKDEVKDLNEITDGYHTFGELYHHRAILTAVLCHENKDKCWKSLKHHDGTMYNDMFIVGIDTPEGPATYHYNIDPYWFLFDVKEVYRAPKWDGHTPNDAIKRIQSLLKENNKEDKFIPAKPIDTPHQKKVNNLGTPIKTVKKKRYKIFK